MPYIAKNKNNNDSIKLFLFSIINLKKGKIRMVLV